MIASYLRKREAAAFEDFGLDRQAEFFEREADRLGHAPPVVDANDVLADPQRRAVALVRRARHRLGPGDARAGRPAAARPTAPGRRIGTSAVEASTGFGPPETDAVDLPDDARRARRPLPALLRAAGWPPHPSRCMMDKFGYISRTQPTARMPSFGPFLVDVDALIGPFGPGPALERFRRGCRSSPRRAGSNGSLRVPDGAKAMCVSGIAACCRGSYRQGSAKQGVEKDAFHPFLSCWQTSLI